MRDLAARVEKVERENRRLRLGLAAVALAALAPWLLGAVDATGPASLEVRELVLRDEHGARRGGLRVDDEGRASLSLADPASRDRMVIATDAAGRSSFALLAEDGSPRARFQTTDDASLNFYDRQGKLRVALGMTGYGPHWVSEALDRAMRETIATGNPFRLDTAKIREAAAPARADQGPVFKLFDPRGRPRIEMRIDMDRAAIFLQTEQGGLRVVQSYAVREGD